MTRTDHKNYIASEWWLQRRKVFLESHSECNRCGIEREAARELYDQDLNVHHRNYQNKGAEKDEDLEALCRRCHELESKSKSELPKWCPDFPIFELDDSWGKNEWGKSSWRLRCPECNFEMVHFETAPCFDTTDGDEPFLTIPLLCENGHRWDLKMQFSHGSIYVAARWICKDDREDEDGPRMIR